jgi:hypothetical protein
MMKQMETKKSFRWKWWKGVSCEKRKGEHPRRPELNWKEKIRKN